MPYLYTTRNANGKRLHMLSLYVDRKHTKGVLLTKFGNLFEIEFFS